MKMTGLNRAALIVCLAICLLFSCVACSSAGLGDRNPSTTTTAPSAGGETTTTAARVSFSFTIVFEDGATKELTIQTAETTLGKALAAEGVIEYDDSGFYTTIDGVTASWDDGQAWWCITKDGEMTDKGLNDLPIAEGDHYEATYTHG